MLTANTRALLEPRRINNNKFTGSVEALDTLTELSYLCVRAGMDMDDVATLLVASLYECGRLEMSAPISVDC